MIELNDTVVMSKSRSMGKSDQNLDACAVAPRRHDVPDTSGEALTRAGHAISEGRFQVRGLATQERAPIAPLYFFLRTLGTSLETMEREIAAAHEAIDARIVPKGEGHVGADHRLDRRVAELMTVLREAGDELRRTRALLRGLAARLGTSPEALIAALEGLGGAGGDHGRG